MKTERGLSMSIFVVVLCAALLIIVSAIHQWKLMILLVVLFAASAGVLVWYTAKINPDIADRKEIESVHIVFGIEKKALLKDLEFQEILRKKYGLVIKGTKTDALAVPEGDLQSIDGFWPSSAWAEELFKLIHPELLYKTHTVFNTPLVIFSWAEVVEELIKQGVIEKKNRQYVIPDMKKFLSLEEQTYQSLRIPRLQGPISVQSADPRQDTSGLLFIGARAVVLNRGNIPDEKEIARILPEILKICKGMGKAESSADILFDRYIKQGQSRYPMISGCENQVIEYYNIFPRYQEMIRTQIRVIFPEPAVLSEHPFIALTKKGELLLTALQDPDIKLLAWKKFGFRSGAENDPGDLKAIGLPEHAEPATSMPSAEVMKKIVEAM